MDATFVILAGVAVFANFAFLKLKLDSNRFLDLATDLFIIVLLSFLFAGTMGGLAIAMIGGFLISIYLWFSPPKIPTDVMDAFGSIGKSIKQQKIDREVEEIVSNEEYIRLCNHLKKVKGVYH
jgi:hypothetical protein